MPITMRLLTGTLIEYFVSIREASWWGIDWKEEKINFYRTFAHKSASCYFISFTRFYYVMLLHEKI